LKCKHCLCFINKYPNNLSYKYVQYEQRHIEIVPTADGGIDKITLDAGIFCDDKCLADYLQGEEL
jgi:hypothetical protein